MGKVIPLQNYWRRRLGKVRAEAQASLDRTSAFLEAVELGAGIVFESKDSISSEAALRFHDSFNRLRGICLAYEKEIRDMDRYLERNPAEDKSVEDSSEK